MDHNDNNVIRLYGQLEIDKNNVMNKNSTFIREDSSTAASGLGARKSPSLPCKRNVNIFC